MSAPDSFATHRIGNVPVILQMGRDRVLRAFVNRCAHRRAPIHLEAFGQKRLACPYHGWTYDDSGSVKSIPSDAVNGHDTCKSALGLDPIALRSIGNLVFVNLGREPIAFESQFDLSLIERLTAISTYLDDQGMFATFRGHFNWKLNFENVVDSDHVPFVHRSSFAPLVPALSSGAKRIDPTVDTGGWFGRFARAIFRDVGTIRVRQVALARLRGALFRGQRLLQFLSLPERQLDLSMGGVIFLAQQFMPVAPAETEVRLTMCTAKSKSVLHAAPAIPWRHMTAEKHVIDEDISPRRTSARLGQ